MLDFWQWCYSPVRLTNQLLLETLLGFTSKTTVLRLWTSSLSIYLLAEQGLELLIMSFHLEKMGTSLTLTIFMSTQLAALEILLEDGPESESMLARTLVNLLIV
jgi:hypothetical protein